MPTSRLLPLLLSVPLAACSPVADALRSAANMIAPAQSPASSVTPLATKPLPDVKLNQSSPDMALKTHFAFQDRMAVHAYNELIKQRAKKAEPPPIMEALPLFDGPVKKYAEMVLGITTRDVTPPVVQTFDRQILKIDNESETRAIATVKIRNTTPLPAGATPDRFDVERRRDGETYRFILSKGANGWVLEDVQEFGYEFSGGQMSKDEVWHRMTALKHAVEPSPLVPSRAFVLFDDY